MPLGMRRGLEIGAKVSNALAGMRTCQRNEADRETHTGCLDLTAELASQTGQRLQKELAMMGCKLSQCLGEQDFNSKKKAVNNTTRFVGEWVRCCGRLIPGLIGTAWFQQGGSSKDCFE